MLLLCVDKRLIHSYQTSAQGVLCGLWACRRVQRFVGLRLYKHIEIDGINGGAVTFWAPKSK